MKLMTIKNVKLGIVTFVICVIHTHPYSEYIYSLS